MSKKENFQKIKGLAPSVQAGFTLIELLISIALFSLVVTISASVYNLGQKTYRAGIDENELWQNARVVLDRETREIRQSVEIVTVLPNTNSDPLDPPATELVFQDGHDTTAITYIRYYRSGSGSDLCQNGTDICRQTIVYFFTAEPAVYVRWDSVDSSNNPPQSSVLTDQLIGEFFNQTDFWNDDNVINIAIGLNKSSQSINLLTAVYGRNL